MIIIPYRNKIQLKIDQPTAGGLDLSSKPTTVEVGTVISDGFEHLKIIKGDRIMFKAWAVDIINYNNENFYFIDADSEGICAIIKE